ncbi:MAG: hypothetical protein EZS28_050083, partial [Streblomastix strix]
TLSTSFGFKIIQETVSKDTSAGRKILSNRHVEFIYPSLKAEGELTYKVGLAIDGQFSFLRCISAGIELEVGAYVKIGGIIDVPDVRDIFKKSPDFAAYFEIGLYAELALIGDIFGFSTRIVLLPIEYPIFKIGYTKFVTLTPVNNSLILSEDKSTTLSSFWLETRDMMTNLREEELISPEDGRLIYTTSNDLEIKAGKITIINKEVQEFIQVIQVRINIVEKPGGGGLLVIELGNLNAKTEITVPKKPIPISSITLSFSQITTDNQYSTIYNLSENDDDSYNLRPTINDIKDFQIGRLIKVTPTISPSNASYKTLTYSFGSMINAVQDVREYEYNGTTYLEFRIKRMDDLIG